jgi:hypothetical protein
MYDVLKERKLHAWETAGSLLQYVTQADPEWQVEIVERILEERKSKGFWGSSAGRN